MTKNMKLSELKQGNIIKVLFGNGDVIKGCYFGKQFVYHGYRGSYISGGNFLVTLDPVSKAPGITNINAHKSDHRTSIKEVSGTRFNKDVSQYLKKYVRALDKQQQLSQEELKMIVKRKEEDEKLAKLAGDVKELNYDVDADTMPVKDRVRLVFRSFDKQLKPCRNINQVDTPEFRQEGKTNQLTFLVTFGSALRVNDRDIGVTPFHEYDGGYAPDVDYTIDTNDVASKYLSVTSDNTQRLVKDLNALKGVEVSGNRLFQVSCGDYAGDGSLIFRPTLILDRDVAESVLQQAQTLLVSYLKKA